LWNWRWTGKKRITQELRAILYDYFVVVYYSGIRPGTEADNIRFCDVAEFTDSGNKFLELRVKGKVGERFISSDYMIKGAVERCRVRIAEDRGDIRMVDDDDLIFGLTCNKGKVPQRLSDVLKKALIECGLLYDKQGKERTLYSLRHSFATNVLLKHGTNVHLLARHMGTSITMIEKHYSHIISRNKVSKLILTSPIPETDILDAKASNETVSTIKRITKKK
jgi:site-specific recombinase XerD